MSIYEDKIKIQRQLLSQDLKFQQIYCIWLFKENLIMLLKDKTIITVPASAFSSQEELNEVLEFIEMKK